MLSKVQRLGVYKGTVGSRGIGRKNSRVLPLLSIYDYILAVEQAKLVFIFYSPFSVVRSLFPPHRGSGSPLRLLVTGLL